MLNLCYLPSVKRCSRFFNIKDFTNHQLTFKIFSAQLVCVFLKTEILYETGPSQKSPQEACIIF